MRKIAAKEVYMKLTKEIIRKKGNQIRALCGAVWSPIVSFFNTRRIIVWVVGIEIRNQYTKRERVMREKSKVWWQVDKLRRLAKHRWQSVSESLNLLIVYFVLSLFCLCRVIGDIISPNELHLVYAQNLLFDPYLVYKLYLFGTYLFHARIFHTPGSVNFILKKKKIEIGYRCYRSRRMSRHRLRRYETSIFGTGYRYKAR